MEVGGRTPLSVATNLEKRKGKTRVDWNSDNHLAGAWRREMKGAARWPAEIILETHDFFTVRRGLHFICRAGNAVNNCTFLNPNPPNAPPRKLSPPPPPPNKDCQSNPPPLPTPPKTPTSITPTIASSSPSRQYCLNHRVISAHPLLNRLNEHLIILPAAVEPKPHRGAHGSRNTNRIIIHPRTLQMGVEPARAAPVEPAARPARALAYIAAEAGKLTIGRLESEPELVRVARVEPAGLAVVAEGPARKAAGVAVEEGVGVGGPGKEGEDVLVVERVSDVGREVEAFFVEEKVARGA
ncbi:hypothetical protein STAS_16020 [Striga asiatica]|uniref:Uncharacterized protein n=1 Tax=Striga asiatica TaxID=4170 RepID=A0A5A7Q2M6_STRAF|nr:hypothetical protein STAS_16020 [Striga asiatica]